MLDSESFQCPIWKPNAEKEEPLIPDDVYINHVIREQPNRDEENAVFLEMM